MSLKRCFSCLFSLIAIETFVHTPKTASAQPEPRVWRVGESDREGLIYSPESAKQQATPVVFAFHGHGGTMASAARSFAYHKHWPEAIVVYMQGLKTPGRLTDPEGKKPGWQSGPGDHGDRDLLFFDKVLESLKQDMNVDETRIYATGHSNGGGFTYLLWQTRGDVFAALAPSAAAALRSDKQAFKPKPVLHVAGENDPLVKFEWQEKMIAAVKVLNGCSEVGKPWNSSGKLTGTVYESSSGTPLITLLHSGGHQFLDQTPPLVVRFFKEHAKK